MITDPLSEVRRLRSLQDDADDGPAGARGLSQADPREFTLPSARLRGERIAALARQIVDAVAEKGECDFVADVAGEMPSFVIAELMGLPLDDGRELYKLTEIIHTAPEAQAPGAGGAGGGQDVRVRPAA